MFPRAKKTVLMGLGGFEGGSGIASAKFLLGKTKELIITDLKPATQLKKHITTINQLAKKSSTKITWHLGGHKKADFESADWVVRNPDVPPSSPFLTIASQRKIPIDNDITLFFRVYGVDKVVGVTGTRGKSTTTALTHAMIKNQYPAAKLGGNIGQSPLLFMKHGTWNMKQNKLPVVLEISNFQLCDLPTIKMSPHVAVWTNLYPDHLNKYPSIKEYIDDKKNIFKYQKAGDTAIFNWDNVITKKIGQQIKNPLFFSLNKEQKNGAYTKNGWFVFAENGLEIKVAKLTDSRLLGEHNQMNTLAAICAAHAYGAGWPAIRKAIRGFAGIPNRLETIYQTKKLTIINDCTATSPQATIAALKSLPSKKIILISGGNSKGSDLKEMARTISKLAKILILVPGNANQELLKYLDTKILNIKYSIFQVSDLKEGVKKAINASKPGEIILFSPGLTWLPLLNEFERGKLFKKLINSRLHNS